MLDACYRFSHTATNQFHDLRNRETIALFCFHSIAVGVSIAIGVAIAIGYTIAVSMTVPVAIAVGMSITVSGGKNCLF